MPSRKHFLLATLVGTALAALSPVGSTAHAQSLREVKLGLPKAADPGEIVYAIKRGFFEKEGLKVQLVELNGSGIVIPQVAAKRIDFDYASISILSIALSKGEPFPARVVYNHQRNNVFQIVTLESSPIKALSELKGKRFGLPTLSGGENPLVRAILSQAGVDWDTLEKVPTGHGPAGWRRLATGDVAAIILPSKEAAKAVNIGIPVRELKAPPPFPTLFTTSIVAHNDTIASDPALVVAFGRALTKATQACRANLVDCAQSFWEHDPKSKPADAAAQKKWTDDNVKVLRVGFNVEFAEQAGQPTRWGYFPEEPVRTWLRILKSAGQITNDQLPIDKLYTNQFADDYIRDGAAKHAAAKR